MVLESSTSPLSNQSSSKAKSPQPGSGARSTDASLKIDLNSSHQTSPTVSKPVPSSYPKQRWQIAQPALDQAKAIAQATTLSPFLAQVLINRGITTPEAATLFLYPNSVDLPSPLEDFAGLAKALEYLQEAIAQNQKIAVCGDYDADGMTSTALIIRSLRELGALVDYRIPSRMKDGYGINRRIVEEFYRQDIRIILTVDNGIAAVDPIAYAVELGMVVIVTDHHDIPAILPPAQVILNPKLISEASPYRGLAGVGVAYILALELAKVINPELDGNIARSDFGYALLDLFTLGTIADLAPLTGVNRRWVQQGLMHLPKSRIAGVRALIAAAGLGDKKKGLKPEAIGFRLGPRINAVGRIADPMTVIELLTTDDPELALERAGSCEQINLERRRLCEEIERDAIAHIKHTNPNLDEERVLVVIRPGWHHGVIGIVASRLVERYGVPVFIGTYENEAQTLIRGSARSIPEFDIHKALVFCDQSLDKYGGHQAAGGFTLQADKLEDFRKRLQLFANMYLRLGHLLPLVKVDVAAPFSELTQELYDQIDRLHPCGIGNPDPVFWTPNVRIVEQKTVGKERSHLKLALCQEINEGKIPAGFSPQNNADAILALEQGSRNGDRNGNSNRNRNRNSNGDNNGAGEYRLTAIAWRWGSYYPLPNRVDIAYRLRLNEWQGETTVELELVGVRLPVSNTGSSDEPQHIGTLMQASRPIEFHYQQRCYGCSVGQVEDQLELRIRNSQGKVLAIQPHSHQALMGICREQAQHVDITQAHFFNLIKAALKALETVYA
ncbi:MAG: single-stranded-DNA-specific exonuclease RecJ [Cyanobacteria bacterium P01_F01_bin.150]